ncbi:MAG: DUF255 domain-containing protein, partial [Rhodobacterales bacterium]|nr:DUF255 domain-containing protein [Rhodobacterales bacterium]
MTNRLAKETSPYLLQHAENPVDWFPWGDEALKKAQDEQRPILLSIGYSACHWCHVMAHESFDNAVLAEQMNRDFVCIKVDREERPDLDEIYMRAVQAFSGGRGGWPMTVFLTPAGEPYWGGTYFPPHRSGQMPGFDEVMDHTARLWTDDRDKVTEITDQIVDYLHRGGRMPIPDEALADHWLSGVFEASQAMFDAENGGFGGAPKFPPHGVLAILLAHWRVSGSSQAMAMATATLDGMSRGGTYDHLAGGFARYSVDESWTIPHFEKMLYDNAQLIPVYADAWLATNNPHYRRLVVETVGWLLREMRLPNGGFAASTDADSEGVEGKFFVWTPQQLIDVLGSDGARVAELCQVTAEGNFEHGQSALRLEEPLERMEPSDADLLRASFPKLLAARSLRIAPDRDDKVVTAWNAMAISALARAGVSLGQPEWVNAAVVAAELLHNQVTVDGRLMRTFKDGRAHVLAYADDHAHLISACLDVYEATFDQLWLARANKVADALVELFWDGEAGGLFYTGSDADALVTRSKNVSGGAEPSANGAAALAFVRLSKLCGRKDLAKRAEVILKGYQMTLERVPRALGVEALAGHWLGNGGIELGVVGDPEQPATASLITEYRRRYTPFGVVAARRKNDTYHLLPWMRGKDAKKGPTAYLCEGRACRAPTLDAAELGAFIDDVLKPDHRST